MRLTCKPVLGALASTWMLALSAGAAMPPVVDRIPADALWFVAVEDISKFQKNAQTLAQVAGLPSQSLNVDTLLNQMGVTKGFKKDGSIAMIALPGPEWDAAMNAEPGAAEKSEPPVVLLVPTDDYGTFLGNWSKTPGQGIDEVSIQGKANFVKKVEGGYAAIAPKKETLDKFTGAPGGAAKFKDAMGAAGAGVADRSDVLLVANMVALRPLGEKAVAKGLERAKSQMAMMGQAGDGAGSMSGIQWLTGTFLKEAKTAIVGLNMGGSGFGMDTAVTWLPDTMMSKVFAAKGGAAELLAKLPAQPYLFAMAADGSSEGLRAFVKSFIKESGVKDEANSVMAWFDRSDGMSVSLGLSPGGIMSGLFASTSMYVKSKDPAAYIESFKTGLASAPDGGGKYKDAAVDVAGTKVDVWDLKVPADPNNPMAGQMGSMLYGPGGQPGGYAAKTEGGVVMTMGKNSNLMASALKAAKGEENLGSNALIKQVAEKLPGNRMAELWIGSKSILDAVLPFAAMSGMNVQVDVPDNLPPVGAAIGAESGAMRMGMYVPAPVIKIFTELANSMRGEARPPVEGEDGGQPRF
ncbi:MAG: hypothetical protein JNM07_10790 [Phycisphaerae bacterium]|nr:hypothetical protein [Phycisphaerae bacterium]